jgi:hypothetical protein
MGEKIKAWLRRWLGIDQIDERSKKTHIETNKRLMRIESNIKMGADIHWKGKNWAVVCIGEGRPLVRFIPLGKQDLGEVRHFVQKFSANPRVIDLPCGVPEKYRKEL